MSPRSRIGLAILLALAGGCGSDSAASDPDAGPSDAGVNDALPGCDVFVTFDPPIAIAGPDTEVRAMANVLGASGVLGYTWQVQRSGVDVAFTFAQADQSAITFAAPQTGPYDVLVFVDAPGQVCPSGQGTINVGAPGGNTTQIRLRIVPPATIAAPPNEKLVLVTGGASFSVGVVAIDPGVPASGQVSSGGTGVQAYLRFIPLGSRDAYVEAFSSTTGGFTTRVLNQVHDVLVVPLTAGHAPRLVPNWTPGMPIAIEPGATVAGVVRGPANAAIAGAKVRLTIGGIPSTVATTQADGTFTLRSIAAAAGASVAVEVTPPAASGLPRLAAASTMFDLAEPLEVRYGASLVLRDIAGATVRRAGTAQAGAKVTIVGTLAAAGTITAGAAASASGEVRRAVTANASGALPSALVPAAPLSAVVDLGAGDHAVAAFDASSAVPSTIDAPPMVSPSIELRDALATPIEGALLEAIPIGALAMAGLGHVRATSGDGGAAVPRLAAGGRYELRVSDPAGRGSPLVISNVAAAAVASSYTLLPALRISGQLTLSGNPAPVGRASVQVLCTACSGLDRTRPLAEGTSDGAGDFNVAVFDPGTM